MRTGYIRTAAAAVAVVSAMLLCSCDMIKSLTGNKDSGTSDTQSSVSSAAQNDSAQSADSSAAADNDSSAAVNEDNTAESDYEYVSDGHFSLPNNKLKFKMPDGYILRSSTIAYQFTGTDDAYKFNLVVSKADKDLELVTEKEMTSTYEITMENFKLEDFRHTEIAGKPAVYMRLSGKVSQVSTTTVITQYMIQSGTDAYCFSFTQSAYDDENFPIVIDTVIDSLVIE